MIYFIAREDNQPWDQSKGTLLMENTAFDMVESNKNSALESVSDFVIDGDVIVKSNPRTHELFTGLYESQTGTKLKELLLG